MSDLEWIVWTLHAMLWLMAFGLGVGVFLLVCLGVKEDSDRKRARYKEPKEGEHDAG